MGDGEDEQKNPSATVALMRYSGGVCMCCGLPGSEMNSNIARQGRFREFMIELQGYERRNRGFSYLNFPGNLQKSHVYHAHMQQFCTNNGYRAERPRMRGLPVDLDQITNFTNNYNSYMVEIHKAVQLPFSHVDGKCTRYQLDTYRAGVVADVFNEATFGSSVNLKTDKDIVLACDEHCNRIQTSRNVFRGEVCRPRFIWRMSEVAKNGRDHEILHNNMLFLMVNALQFNALCKHYKQRRDNPHRESSLLWQLANNRNLHLCYVLYEYSTKLMHTGNPVRAEHISMHVQMWWRLIVSEYCLLQGKQLVQLVFPTDVYGADFTDGLTLDGVAPETDGVLQFFATFLRGVKEFVQRPEYYVLLHKLLVLSQMHDANLLQLQSALESYKQQLEELDNRRGIPYHERSLPRVELLLGFFIGDTELQNMCDTLRRNVNPTNYRILSTYYDTRSQYASLFRLFATGLHLCSSNRHMDDVRNLYDRIVHRADGSPYRTFQMYARTLDQIMEDEEEAAAGAAAGGD